MYNIVLQSILSGRSMNKIRTNIIYFQVEGEGAGVLEEEGGRFF